MHKIFTMLCLLSLISCASGQPTQNASPDQPTMVNTVEALASTTPIVEPTLSQPTQTSIPLTATPQATSISDVMQQFTDEQRRCVAIQIGKERVPAIIAGDQLTPKELAVVDACRLNPNTKPSGTPPSLPTGDNPVFADETWITSSVDGKRWQTPVLLDTAASVPEIVALPDGSLLAMWCSFKDKPARFAEKLHTARLPKGATEWILEGPKIITGAQEANITYVDPDLLLLPDGRLRLYAYNIQTDETTHTIVSAISSDNGQSFTVEAGIRFATRQMWDPNVVIQPDGTFRMYYNGKDAIRSASSRDGLTFTADDGDRWVRGAIPGALVEGETIWLYGCEKGIARRSSVDGLTFSDTEQLAIRAVDGGFFCDPSITKSADKYWLILKRGIAKAPPQP